MEEPTGLFALMADLHAGRTISLQPLDLEGIFARFAARRSELQNRDVVDERFHNALTARADDGEDAYGKWLRGF